LRAAIAALLVFLAFLAIGYFTAGGRLELPWKGWNPEIPQTQQGLQSPQATLGEDEVIPRSPPFLAYGSLYDYGYVGDLYALISCSTSAEGALVTVSCSGWANLSYRPTVDSPEAFLSYYYREAVVFNTSAGVAKVSIQEYVVSSKGRLVPYANYEGEHRYRLVALKPESMWVGKPYLTTIDDRWFEGFKIQVAKLVAEEVGNGTYRITLSPPPEEYVRVAEEAASLWASAIEYFLGTRPQISVEPLKEQVTLEGSVSKLREEVAGQPGLVRLLIDNNYSFINALCGRRALGCAFPDYRLIASNTYTYVIAHEIGHYLGFPHIYLEEPYLPIAAGSLMYSPPGSTPEAASVGAPRRSLSYLDMVTLSYLLLTAKGFHGFEMNRTAIYYACWEGINSLFFLIPEIEGVDRIFGSWFSHKGVPLTPGLFFMFTYSGVGGAIEAHRLVEALLAGAGGRAYSPFYGEEFVVRPFYGKWEGC